MHTRSVLDRLLAQPDASLFPVLEVDEITWPNSDLASLQRDIQLLLSTPSKGWLNPLGIVDYSPRGDLPTLSLSKDRTLPPRVSVSTYNYGIPSLVGRTIDLLNVEELCVAIVNAIAAFEPRIDAESVKVVRSGAAAVDSATPYIIGIELRCNLLEFEEVSDIVVNAEFNVETGASSVKVKPFI